MNDEDSYSAQSATLISALHITCIVVDFLTHAVIVRTVVENLRRKLKLTMLDCMHIIDNPHKNLLVPETAVVCEVNQDYVIFTPSGSQFLRIPVKLNPETTAIRSLAIKQNIVVDGALHLNNEHNKLAELE